MTNFDSFYFHFRINMSWAKFLYRCNKALIQFTMLVNYLTKATINCIFEFRGYLYSHWQKEPIVDMNDTKEFSSIVLDLSCLDNSYGTHTSKGR